MLSDGFGLAALGGSEFGAVGSGVESLFFGAGSLWFGGEHDELAWLYRVGIVGVFGVVGVVGSAKFGFVFGGVSGVVVWFGLVWFG